MKLYKLTDTDNTTYHKSCKWGKNISHKATGRENRLCSDGVIHAYKNINLALLLNPIHSCYDPCNIWKAEGTAIAEDWGKVGCKELTTNKQLKIPEWYRNEKTRQKVRVQFAILCAETALRYFEEKFPNDDRLSKAILAAKKYLKKTTRITDICTVPYDVIYDAVVRVAADAAYAATRVVVNAVAYAVNDTVRAANAVAYAVDSAIRAANAAANAAADAADAAAHAADAAAHAADAATRVADDKINFCLLANKAVEMVTKVKA